MPEARSLEAPAARPSLRVMPAVSVSRATRRFGAVTALEGVSLSVRPGEVHALLGPNGAGKTTLLRLLTGLTAPTAGDVTVLGAKVVHDDAALRSCIGFVPAGDRTFYERLSGEENLLFFARLHGLRKAAARRRAREVLAEVALADAGSRRVAAYSHGMQKRLSVARALLMAPPVLLVDEATHDLDPGNAGRVRELVAELAGRGSAILWATQRIEEIRGFADSVTLLVDGRVRFSGDVPALLARASSRRYVLRVGTLAPVDVLQAAAGPAARVIARGGAGHVVAELEPDATLGDLLSGLVAAGVVVHDCRRELPEAEDAFLAVSEQAAT